MGGSAPGIDRKYVRVTGTRRDRFVEFEFSVNDADLTVELVMPVDAFREFCRANDVVMLPPPPAAMNVVETFWWREAQVGRTDASEHTTPPQPHQGERP